MDGDPLAARGGAFAHWLAHHNVSAPTVRSELVPGGLVGWKGLFVAGQDDVPNDALIPYTPYPASAGYGVHDVYVSWTPRDGLFGGATARLTVQNLFDKDYKAYFNGFSAKGRSVKAAVAYTF